jgi:hypothetical protein
MERDGKGQTTPAPAGPKTGRARLPRFGVRKRRRFKVAIRGYPSSFTIDVGRGGFCTELMRVLPEGTEVDGSILADGKEVPFTGCVAWNKPGDAQLGLRGRMGIRFTQITGDFAKMLETP